MKYIMCSRVFPKGHPKEGQPTHFVEKILRDLSIPDYWSKFQEWNKDKPMDILHEFSRTFYYPVQGNKHHTIRPGSRFKPGDMASLRVWSDKPYRSKQIEFAQVEVKKTWEIEIWLHDRISIGFPEIPGVQLRLLPLCEVAENDGLDCRDFEAWFRLHPKKAGKVFKGQIICWDENINYEKL